MSLGTLTQLENIPAELRQFKQFLCFDTSKKPVSPSTGNSVQWQNNLCDFDRACWYAQTHGLGIGIAFNGQTSFTGFDLDGCICPETQKIEPWAITILQQLPSYREISISGSGIKVLCFGHHTTHLPTIRYGDAIYAGKTQQIEFSTISRYFALTGQPPTSLPQYAIARLDPLRIYKWLKPDFNETSTQATQPASVNSDHFHQRLENAAKYVQAMPAAISGQGGHNSTYTVACRLIQGFDLTVEQAMPIMQQYNQGCQPPWSDAELLHKLGDAQNAEDREGRSRGYLNRDELPILESVKQYADAFLQKNNSESQGEIRSHEYQPFPTGLLPEPLNRFVSEASEAICCDPSFVALPLIAGLASAIGDSRRLYIKSTWQVPAIIWAAFIGESGTAKSPAFRLALQFVRDKQAELTREYEQLLKDHEREVAVFEQQLAKWKKNQKWQPDLPMPMKPVAPPHPRTTVNDSTIEALISILADNPKGVLCAFDELAGWIGSFDRYKSKGESDSASWLSIYNGDSISVDRKQSGYTHIQNAYVSIVGGIQPGILGDSFTSKHRESGLLQRILLAWPDRKAKRWTEDDVSAQTNATLKTIFSYCYSLKPKVTDDAVRNPHLFQLNAEAKALWVNFYNQHNSELSNESGNIAAAFSKLEEYPLRFAIVFKCVAQSLGDSQDSWISADILKPAIDLAIWFRNEAKRIYELLNLESSKSDQRKLVQWITKHGGSTTARDLQHNLQSKYPYSKNANDALNQLVAGGLGNWEEVATTKQGGRPTKRFHLNS